MTDLATIRAAAEAPAFTPEGERLKSMMRALLALLPSDAAPAGEAPYEPTLQDAIAFTEGHNDKARYVAGAPLLAVPDPECIKAGLKRVWEKRNG